MAETIPKRRTCAICDGVVDRCPIRAGRLKTSKKEARRRLWRPNAFDKYPNQVCFNCDSRAIYRGGEQALADPVGGLRDNPVFIDGIKCWRLSEFDTYVTMRDNFDSSNLPDFLDQNGVNRCKVDTLTLEDIESVTKWLPQLQETAKADPVHGPHGSDAHPLLGLRHSLFALAEKVMEGGSEFNWPEWQAIARLYLEGASSVESATLETCVRLLITHIRKDRFCEGYFMAVVKTGHVLRVLTRLESIRNRRH